MAVATVVLAIAAACFGPAPPTPSASTPSPTISPSPSPSPSGPVGLTREQAMAVARDVSGADPTAPVMVAEPRRYGHLYESAETFPPPGEGLLVWYVNLGHLSPSPTGGQGWLVILDYYTGQVLESTFWIG